MYMYVHVLISIPGLYMYTVHVYVVTQSSASTDQEM